MRSARRHFIENVYQVAERDRIAVACSQDPQSGVFGIHSITNLDTGTRCLFDTNHFKKSARLLWIYNFFLLFMYGIGFLMLPFSYFMSCSLKRRRLIGEEVNRVLQSIVDLKSADDIQKNFPQWAGTKRVSI